MPKKISSSPTCVNLALQQKQTLSQNQLSWELILAWKISAQACPYYYLMTPIISQYICQGYTGTCRDWKLITLCFYFKQFLLGTAMTALWHIADVHVSCLIKTASTQGNCQNPNSTTTQLNLT